jgi:SagB-type dehydrogenase family enzyme
MNPTPKSKENKVTEFNYPIIKHIPLPKPKMPKVDLLTCISERRSASKFKKMNLEGISQILWLSAKIKKVHVQKNGYILSHRPAPSAGGRHPIDILVQLDNKGDLFYYNAFDHSLNKLDLKPEILKKLNKHSHKTLPRRTGTMIWFISHKDWTEAKYKHSKSLIWRDSGALIYCFQLAGTALGINSCPVGTLGEPFLGEAFKKYGKIQGVGGVVIG